MSEHTVAFHIGTERVVCTCGADFYDWSRLGLNDAVSNWAQHVREAAEHNLTDAYEAGWRDACDDHLRQHSDPGWPIGYGKRKYYPAPERYAPTESTTESQEARA